MKVKLTAIYHNDTDKDGNKLVSKDGRPYERCRIKTAQHGDQYVSGFGGPITHSWNVGDEVDIIVENKGQYLNFSVPKAGALNEQILKDIQADLKLIKDKLGIGAPAAPKPSYPEYSQEPDF